TYTASFDAKTATVRDVVNEINKSGIATAFVDEKGQLNVKGTGSDDVEFGFGTAAVTAAAPGAPTATEIDTANGAAVTAAGTGGSNTAIGFLAADATAAGAIKGQSITSAVRSNLIDQYNDLRGKIDDLAKDASFNGINLLKGDRLSIQFNEKAGKNQTKLDIQGSDVTSDNLGIVKAGNTTLAGQVNFQNDTDLEKATQALTGALTSLKSLSSTFGANLSVAQTRQDFTKDMADVLSTGSANLVNVDANSEAASLLALQTRQQLSQTALSLSNQSEQSVLRLF
ncbi:flagellin, partial [Bosea sp. CER48]|uniref:flagellin n=1 Tax=Bosea sp. CER48 TaxID=3377035 RepID=UPI00381C6325